MPDELRERLEEAAEQSGRSMNAEIVARLLKSFQPTSELKRAEIAEIVRATIDELRAAAGPRK